MFLLAFALLIIPSVSAVEIENQTIIQNVCLNSSFQILQNMSLDLLVVNSSCAGDINNLTAFFNPDILFINNTNNTAGEIQVFNLVNALIFNKNGTLLQEEFTGDINLTIEPSNSIVVENNFNITFPQGGGTIGGGGLNQDGGTENNEINNTLDSPVLVKIFNLTNTFIYMSNGTVLSFITGDINITIAGNEYFYIVGFNTLIKLNENSGTTAHDLSGNSNNGIITGTTWVVDGVLITLTELIDYTINPTTGLFTTINKNYEWSELLVSWVYGIGSSKDDLESIKGNYSQLLINESAQLPTIGTIIGISILIIILIALLTFAIQRMRGVSDTNMGKSSSKFKGSSRDFG